MAEQVCNLVILVLGGQGSFLTDSKVTVTIAVPDEGGLPVSIVSDAAKHALPGYYVIAGVKLPQPAKATPKAAPVKGAIAVQASAGIFGPSAFHYT